MSLVESNQSSYSQKSSKLQFNKRSKSNFKHNTRREVTGHSLSNDDSQVQQDNLNHSFNNENFPSTARFRHRLKNRYQHPIKLSPMRNSNSQKVQTFPINYHQNYRINQQEFRVNQQDFRTNLDSQEFQWIPNDFQRRPEFNHHHKNLIVQYTPTQYRPTPSVLNHNHREPHQPMYTLNHQYINNTN